MSATTLNIIALEMADGDPGYFVHGHVDVTDLVKAVNATFEEELYPEDGCRTYLTETVPARFIGRFDKPDSMYDQPYWWQCKESDPGAFPATLVRP